MQALLGHQLALAVSLPQRGKSEQQFSAMEL